MTKAGTRQQAWREEKRRQGYREIMAWLTPEASHALNEMMQQRAGSSIADILNLALLQAHEGGLRVSHDTSHDTSLETTVRGLVRQVADLTEWKERMASTSARAGSGQRRPQVKSDTAAIIKAAADQMEETGQELYVPRLHEELLAKGVAVIRGQNNFYPWIQRHQREIDAELARRRKAAAKSETPQLSLLNIGSTEI